ncbi:acyltransferase [Psychrosphaera sp. B3R10]|uniref:acyltransferase n=1 Tax=unclassified Psychrosphaera TaxID=2641570 RepID=UPI001C0A2DB9|nr:MULTISPECIES: acyltransferase [unclassified Psychrosphaera]MBU2880386.1 acyltransferase [Psychrosphaera sp. I2R16]MBU2987825.1 acyltransferase [Psychrosphaera sp. B3R10]MDO6720665.1 acyltransferase [Psychrosphaera sp. 1_MG-2023]
MRIWIENIVGSIVGVMSFCLYCINTIFWSLPIFALSVFKLIPFASSRKFITILLDFCAASWVSVNTVIQKILSPMKITVTGDLNLSKKDWYLVISNHQSWVDIVVLQRVFNGKIPFLKFFLKEQLRYVPILGLTWWALDFPFMKRYTKSFLAKNPHLKGKDLATTREACEKFKYKPVSVMNFIEGTRYTDKKHENQNSKYTGLLKPKSGGIGFVFTVMGEQLHKVIDVTIYYPQQIPTFWHFLSGRIRNVSMHIDVHEITQDIIGDYSTDKEYKKRLHSWINGIWTQKQETLLQLKLQSESQT